MSPIGAPEAAAAAIPLTGRPVDRRGVGVIQPGIGAEVLEEVEDQPLHDSGDDHAAADVLGRFGFSRQGGGGLEADQQQDGDSCLEQHVGNTVHRHHRRQAGMDELDVLRVGKPVDQRQHRDEHQ